MNALHRSADDQPSLLLVDDDSALCVALGRALTRRGFAVSIANDADAASAVATANPPEYAVVDLRMPGASGLAVVKMLRDLDTETRIVVLTGYASVATAIEAIKLGAVHYLAKPADADEIVRALGREHGDPTVPVTSTPLSVGRLEWEHLQKVLADHDGNISATSRALRMHRRTLQRKLAKKPIRD